MSQKILAEKSGKKSVSAGELVLADIDLALGNDITAPVAIKEFDNAGFDKVYSKEKIALVSDHFTPNKDIKSAQQSKIVREFAKKYGILHFYEGGEAGIEHSLIPEKGLAKPGDLIVGADSHTCTYGALGCFSTGVGSTDLAVAMASGKAWFKVPEAIRVELKGNMKYPVSGKDIILTLIGKIGVSGALYSSLEFTGEGVASVPMDDRFTISNMAIEAGAKNGIFSVDEQTADYVKTHGNGKWNTYEADKDAEYTKTVEIDLNTLEPVVAFPHLPSNIKTAGEAESMKIKLDQIVIGSCTNGRYSDLEIAAKILNGKHIDKNLRVIIIPSTPEIYKKALKEGLLEIFMEAGCIISPPTCGPCLGGYMGILAEGERALSTTNRNFVGRMGHTDSEVYLCSPAVAAVSALNGYISDVII